MDYCKKPCKYSRISELPDDVLVSILSLLPGTEAVATCVLSRRWEKLWTFTTGTLTFSHPEWLMVETQSEADAIKPEFISWVNHAVRLHQGPTLQEFCIQFSLDQLSASHIDTWINFAIGKKVQRLHLNFMRWTDGYSTGDKDYYFPNLNLLHSRAAGFSNFINSLTELSLAYINVDESLVQYFLSNCPNLEKLCLESSCSLLNLRVAAPPKLRHLEISCCYNLENIEIAAPNLVFLKYIGDTIRMTLNNVPKLVEAHMRDGYAENLINNIPDHLSAALSQLEALTLGDICLGQCRRVRRIPNLLNLKRLVLTVFGRDDQIRLLPVIDLLKAAPFLHTFVLELSIYRNKEQNIRKVGKAAKYRHQYLKVVELSGFTGLPIDVEIASHLLETAISLEKITIHTEYGENRLETKERAKQLKEKLPAGAELVVL